MTTHQLVTIVGLDFNSRFVVHDAGCRDLAKHLGRRCNPWPEESFESKTEILETIWGDLIDDERGPWDFADATHFAPCVHLPDRLPQPEETK